MPLSPLARRAGRAFGAVALLAASAGAFTADAQPACATASFATYLQTGYRCTLGGYQLFNFDLEVFAATPVGTTQTGPAEDGTTITLTPFATATSFGFEVAGLTAAASIGGTTRNPVGSLWTYLSFWGVGQTRLITGAAFTYALDVQNTSATASHLGRAAEAQGRVFWDDFCLEETPRRTAVGSAGATRTDACPAPIDEMYTELHALADLWRQGGTTSRLTGSVSATVTRVEFFTVADPSVVPEPATWALLGTGLVAVAGVARRKAR